MSTAQENQTNEGATPAVRRPHFSIARLLRRFHKAREGSISVVLALGLPTLLALVGGAIDYTSISGSQTRLRGMADAAALAVAREMTLTELKPARVQELAESYVRAGLGSGPDGTSSAKVTATLSPDGRSVRVSISSPIETPFGLIERLAGLTNLDVTSTARVSDSTAKTKLCMLSLGESQLGGIFLHNGAYVQAPECMLHSNSNQREAVMVQNGSQVWADLICARGGVVNQGGVVRAMMLSDCPAQTDPLAGKPEPNLGGSCLENELVVRDQKLTLQPGIYCRGLTIEGNAQVTLNPGIYIFRNGPLVVSDNAELIGPGVTLMFAGKKSYFRFLDNSLIRISAPTAGRSAGMLIWESKTFVPGDNSWTKGGCGGPKHGNDNYGPMGCGVPTPGSTPAKKVNEHHINSDRARELTGTIYLRQGMLLIDSRQPVADQSPFTVFVVNKLDLYDGPQLMLNSNYSATSVPVPQGLGPLGAKTVRLEM